MKIAIKHRTNNCKDYMGSHPVVVITDKELWCSRVASFITRLIVMCLFSVYISRQAECWHRRVQWWYGDRWSGDCGKATWWHRRWTWSHPVTEQRTSLTLLCCASWFIHSTYFCSQTLKFKQQVFLCLAPFMRSMKCAECICSVFLSFITK